MQERFIIEVNNWHGHPIGYVDVPSREDGIGEIMPIVEKALLDTDFIEISVIKYEVDDEGEII